jgi:hypothetical protein
MFEKATLTSDPDGHTLGASNPPQDVKRKDFELAPDFCLKHIRKSATLCGRELIYQGAQISDYEGLTGQNHLDMCFTYHTNLHGLTGIRDV